MACTATGSPAAEPLPDPERAEPPVLVVHGSHPARCRDPHTFARGVDHLVLGGMDVFVAKVPGALLAENARRLAALIPDDDTPCDLEVAVRVRERRGVEPERVVVPGHQRGRDVPGDPVEVLLGRLDLW